MVNSFFFCLPLLPHSLAAKKAGETVGKDTDELLIKYLSPLSEKQTVFQLKQKNSYEAIQLEKPSALYQ
jgi:hypothetical protein